jgi:hypothetical protein
MSFEVWVLSLIVLPPQIKVHFQNDFASGHVSGELPVSPLVLSLSLLALLFLLHHVWFSHFLPFAFCFLGFVLVSSFVELGKIMAEFPHYC